MQDDSDTVEAGTTANATRLREVIRASKWNIDYVHPMAG